MQSYKNHRRYYIPHHFIYHPVMLVLIIWSVYQACEQPEYRSLWLFGTALAVMLSWLSVMLRQHYALGVQDRVVRLEMRLRYYQLTNQRLEVVGAALSFGQIAALRFASDEELPSLVEKAIAENLSPNAIKKMIGNWQADKMRV